MTWVVRTRVPPEPVELVQHWKHGWIPLTPEAVAIKDKQKSGHLKSTPGAKVKAPIKSGTAPKSKTPGKPKASKPPASPGKLGYDEAMKAPDKHLPPWARQTSKYSPAEHKKLVNRYLKDNPGGFSAEEDTPAVPQPKAKMKPGVSKKPAEMTPAEAIATPGVLPKAMRTNSGFKGKTDAEWHAEIRAYLKEHPEGYSAGHVSSPAEGDGDSFKHMSPAQRVVWDDLRGTGEPGADPVGAANKLDSEWATVDDAPPPDPDEEEMLEWWQFGDDELSGVAYYQLLNNLKRSGSSSGDEDVDAELEAMDETLQRRLAKSRAARDLTLFRGITNATNVQVGDTLTDAGWAAASYNPVTADGFRQSAKNRMLIIHARKGAHLMRVPDPQEHEILFGPDTPMRVTRVEGNEIHVEVG